VVLNTTDGKDAATVANVGAGIALRVRVDDVNLGDFEIGGKSCSVKLRFPNEVAMLRPAEIATIQVQAVVDGEPISAALSAHLDERFANQDLTVTVRYENVEGRAYASDRTSAPGRLVLSGPRSTAM
jgi:hypothetical protein